MLMCVTSMLLTCTCNVSYNECHEGKGKSAVHVGGRDFASKGQISSLVQFIDSGI